MNIGRFNPYWYLDERNGYWFLALYLYLVHLMRPLLSWYYFRQLKRDYRNHRRVLRQ